MTAKTKKPSTGKPRAKAKPRNGAAASRKPNTLWLEKTLEEMIAEQGIKPMTNWKDYFGAGRDLWKDDKDFEEFLQAARRPFSERI